MLNPVVLMTALKQCLCETLTAADYGYPAPCFCGIIPGNQVIPEMMSNCGSTNGVAWVRLILSYPSERVGVLDQRVNNCGTGLGIDLEIGVLREHSEYYESDVMSEEDSALITAWQIADMMAARRAISCCEALLSEDYVIGQYQGQGPQGGLVGGAWQVHVGML